MLPADPAEARAVAATNPLWYHTVEIADGVASEGWFDLRPIVSRMPWPDLQGKRCLDVGTYDGFLAFEMEERGASEVVAMDISDHNSWDWTADRRAEGPEILAARAGEKGDGFAIARRLRDSAVRKVECSVYDLDPNELGSFEFVICGSLLLHLRDPMRALEAIRQVCEPGGHFLSAEAISLRETVLHPRRPVATLDGISNLLQWWTPNLAAHRRMVHVAGFEIERRTRPYGIPFGEAHPVPTGGLGLLAGRLGRRLMLGGQGVPHAAVLARRRV